jgi:hypothetical protein
MNRYRLIIGIALATGAFVLGLTIWRSLPLWAPSLLLGPWRPWSCRVATKRR